MTRVLLTRPHTHAGKPCAAGERIEVDAASAAWLLAHEIASPSSGPAPGGPDAGAIRAPDPKPAKPIPEPKPAKESFP